MKDILEKAKEFRGTSELKIKKLKQQHTEEITEVKIQNLRMKEELRSIVKEKERVQESERILLNTFDTLKSYYERPTDSLKCTQCGFTCKDKSELDRHNQTSHTIVYACISCNFTTDSKSDQDEHVKTHLPSTERTVYQCEMCGKEGDSKQDMEVHLQNSHTCHQCKTMHKDLYELNRHKEKEHGKKRINCTLCHFIANSEQNLKDHMPNHETEKSKCEVCEKMFRSREEIDEHIQTVHVKEMFDHFVKSKKKPVNNGYKRMSYRPASQSKSYSSEERRRNGPCVYWSRGCCTFGESCRFAHQASGQDIPLCRYQERCFRKSTCKFAHHEQRSSFLDRSSGYRNQF